MDTRTIIDYAMNDNAKAMRDALYASIHDRVNAHIQAQKQEVAQSIFPEEVEEFEEEVEMVYEANIEPTSAKSRTHIGNLSNPVVNSVVRSGKEIGLITKQPSGEYHAHHSAAKLAHAQSNTFDTKDKAHQFIRDAHAKAIKNGTLKSSFVQKEEVEQIDELSKSTLGSYLDKKKSEYMKGKTQSGSKENAKDIQNMGKAHDKMNKEELIGGQKKLDKNHNGKLDGQDFKILRSQKNEGVMDTAKKVGGKLLNVMGHGSDEDMKKDLQKKMGMSQNDVTTDTLAGRVTGGAPNQHSSHKIKLKAEAVEKDNKPPFDGPYTKVKGTVKDKSGAEHTPMSRARHLAKQAMSKVKTEMLGKAGGTSE